MVSLIQMRRAMMAMMAMLEGGENMPEWKQVAATTGNLNVRVSNEQIVAGQNEVLIVRVRGTTAHTSGTMTWGFVLVTLDGAVRFGGYRKKSTWAEGESLTADTLTIAAASTADSNHRWTISNGKYYRSAGDTSLASGEYVEYCQIPLPMGPDDEK